MADFADDFNRANGGLGSNWTTLSGYSAPQISSNHILASGTTDIGAGHNTTHSVNMAVQATYTYTATGFQAGSINARMASLSSTANCYRMLWLNSIGGGTVQLLKRVSGTDNDMTATYAVGNGTHTFKIVTVTVGSKVVVLGFVDGALVLRAVDSSSPITTGGYGTCEAYNATASQVQIDDFSIVERGVALTSDTDFGTGGYWMGYTSGGSDATSGTAKVLVHSTGAFNDVTSYNTVQTDEQLGLYATVIYLAAGDLVLCGGTDTTATNGHDYGMGYGNDTAIAAVNTAALEGLSRWTTYPKVGLTAHSAGSYAADGWRWQNPELVAGMFFVDGFSDMDDEATNHGVTIWADVLDVAMQYDGTAASWNAAKATRNPYNRLTNNTLWADARRVPVLAYHTTTDDTFIDASQQRVTDAWGVQASFVAAAGDHSTIHNSISPQTVLDFFNRAKWTAGQPVAVVLADTGSISTSRSPSVTFDRAPLEDDIVALFPSSTTQTQTPTAPSGWTNPLGGTTDVESDAHELAVVWHKVTSGEGGSTTAYAATNLYGGNVTGYTHGVVVAGADPTSPVAATNTGSSTSNATPHVLPGVTDPDVDDGLVVSSVARDGTGAYSTDPAGWVSVLKTNTNQARATLYRYELAQDGVAVGSANIAPSAGDEYAAVTLVFAPAPSESTVTKHATFTGAGVLAAQGTRTARATATFAGAGTLAVQGTRTARATATLAGAGSFAPQATRTVTRSATFAGGGTLAASGARTVIQTATFTGTGTLAGQATRTARATATFAGGGVLEAEGHTARARTATFAGAGSLAAQATRTVTRSASFAGGGVFVASSSSTTTVTRHATFAGTGTLAAQGTRTVTRSALFAGGGTCAPVGHATLIRTAGFAGGGVFAPTSSTVTVVTKPATFTGGGVFAPTGTRTVTRSCSFAGGGTASAQGTRTCRATATFTGGGELAGKGTRTCHRRATFAGTGTLAAQGHATLIRTATFTGAGSFFPSGKSRVVIISIGSPTVSRPCTIGAAVVSRPVTIGSPEVT